MMKKIKPHIAPDPALIQDEFVYRLEKIAKYKETFKTKFRLLFFLYRDCLLSIYLNRMVHSLLKKERDIFLLGLSAISEVCRLSSYPNQEKQVEIDETGRFNIVVSDLSEIDVEWVDGIFMALIARDKSKLDNILSLSTSTLKKTMYTGNTDVSKYALVHLQLVINYFKNNEFSNVLYDEAAKIENEYKSVMTPANNYAALFYMRNLVTALKALSENNEAGFNETLIAALEDHKTFWQQKRPLNPGGTPLCREYKGFMSFELTAYAAIAHDRGWKLEVESDYMPAYMVDGSFLK